MGTRRFPDSIAARTALTVVLALLLTQAFSALIYLTDRGEGRPVYGPHALAQRVAAITTLVETTPRADRPRVVAALEDPVLTVAWGPNRPNVETGDGGPRLAAWRTRLRGLLRDGDREILVSVRRDRAEVLPPPGPLASGEPRWVHSLRLAVALDDGSWLEISTGDPGEGPFRLVRFALWIGAVVVVVTGLSMWASRRLTAPLARFAAAAERLGVDGEAAPLPESGPAELRAATAAFNRMQARLRRFVADRTQMLAAISHDLRTPLTRLRLRAEMVEDPETQRKMMADLDEMAAMIAATLAFARDDAEREPRGPLDLADLLQSLCDDRIDAGRPADYAGPSHLAVDGRAVALRRAFANVMDNALTYGGQVRVGLTVEDGHARIDVDDDGPGIPEPAFEQVFAPFQRLDHSRSRDTGGVGLGLATARSIIRGHGGDITLANRPEGGLRVRATLPNLCRNLESKY